jgi:AhpD family alkylhydroperoxidase
MKTTTNDTQQTVHETVRKGYAAIATRKTSSRSRSCGCGGKEVTPQNLAQKIGYSAEELAAVPEGANMGLSCGNPAALAALKPGETVLDLGSGGGFDVFIAGRKVGATGRAIGVDMTPEMLAKARHNIESYRQQSGLNNVQFLLGEIEHLPVADNSVDVIISNCVINLSPDKAQVWREIARVLKPGGRVAVSDLALLRPLPQAIREMVEAVIGCVGGAVLVGETEGMARAAGLTDIVLTKKSDILKAKADWNDPLYRKIVEHLPAGTGAADFVTSLEVQARKAPSTVDYSPAVNELVAIGAAVAANCEPCLKHHYHQARQLGVSKADMARAVEMAVRVKDSPHEAILRLAAKLTESEAARPADASDPGYGSQGEDKTRENRKCCG